MQEGAHQKDSPLWISKDPHITKAKRKLIQRNGRGLGVVGRFEGSDAGREFQFLEVMWENVLANEVLRHFSNFISSSI